MLLRVRSILILVRAHMLAMMLAVALVAGCGSNATSGGTAGAGGTLVKVVTTTTQLADFASVVGGSHVEVYGVLKANVDAHDYEASPADLLAIAGAVLIVKNGV